MRLYSPRLQTCLQQQQVHTPPAGDNCSCISLHKRKQCLQPPAPRCARPAAPTCPCRPAAPTCPCRPAGRLALIFELMDMNIYELIRGRRHYVAEERVQHFMYQLMKALDHMHRNGIFHR